MRKKWLSLALALVMCLSLMPSAFAAEGASVDKFTDVPADAWYKEELAYAVYNGYISGTSATTFSPDGLVTRGQFVTILGRMLKVDTSAYTSSKFTDVDMGSWYGPYVAWAASNRYVNGTSSTTFAPTANITFEQMGTILANYIQKSGVSLTPSSDFYGYADYASISDWAKFNMDVMAVYNLLPVDVNGNVRPKDKVLRSEATVALVRLAKGDGKGGKPISDGTFVETNPDEVVIGGDYEVQVADRVKAIHDELWASGKITRTSTEKEKAIAYYKWFAYSCRYGDESKFDMEPWMAHSSFGPLVLGYGVCEGLSQAYKALLDYEGIRCEFIPAPERNHAYNAATLDGVYYKEIDVTAITGECYGSGPDMSVYVNAIIKRYFYPDEWQAEQDRNSGFTKPTEEELQQMLDSWQ